MLLIFPGSNFSGSSRSDLERSRFCGLWPKRSCVMLLNCSLPADVECWMLYLELGSIRRGLKASQLVRMGIDEDGRTC